MSSKAPVKPRFSYRAGVSSITPAKANVFLQAIAEGSEDKEAAEHAGVSVTSVQDKRRRDAVFAEAYAEARAVRKEVYRSAARRRAIDGWQEPIYYRGEVVGHKTVYSDRLLELLLKAEDPDNFGDRHVVEVLVTPMTGDDVHQALAVGNLPGAPEALEAVALLFAQAAERKAIEANTVEGSVVE